MVVQIEVLYRNGVEDKFKLLDVSEHALMNFKDTIKIGLGSNDNGYLELGENIIIRFNDVIRVSIKELEL